MLTTFVIPEGLPEKVKADKNWLEYVVTGLIKNAHDRTKAGHGVRVPISVKFQFVTGLNNWKNTLE
jgi:signal transduction histidine kinase